MVGGWLSEGDRVAEEENRLQTWTGRCINKHLDQMMHFNTHPSTSDAAWSDYTN